MMHAHLQPLLLAICASAMFGFAPICALAQGTLAPSMAPGAMPPPLVPGAPAAAPSPAGACDRCGKVQSINQVTAKDQWTPLGSVPTSSDLGPTGVAVYQIGPGFSNQGQVFIGAAGGGVYQTRANQRNVTRWEIVVKMDDGSARSIIQGYEPLFVAGDRVHVFGTQVELLQ